MTWGHRRAVRLALVLSGCLLAPGEAQNRMTLASVLLMLSRRDEARMQASAALQLATTDDERRAAQQVIDAIARPPAAPGAGR